MAWLETDVRDQRIQFVIAATRRPANVSAVCRAFGISRKTGYKWLHRHQLAGSVTALADQSRQPHQSPTRTDTRITRRVMALREAYGWGGEKLAWLLTAEGIQLSPRTIDRIIQREGLTRRDAAPAPALGRFERAAPNELWQLDAKGHYPVRPGGRCYPLSVLDDHSRYAVGLYALPALETRWVQPALIRCFERYGVPTAMLMDHGTPWWDAGHWTGLTRLSVFLLKQGIRLIYGRVRHPQTRGKVERFHRTLAERLRWAGVPTDLAGFAAAFEWFREEYNHVRPHESLAMQPPAWRFRSGPRVFVPAPARWAYPPASDVRRIDHAGMLTYEGRRYFVSEALIDEQVACTRLQRRVLVVYRHMYVRELHLRAGRSVSLLQPIDEMPPVEAAGAMDAHNASTSSLENAPNAFSTAATGINKVLPMS